MEKSLGQGSLLEGLMMGEGIGQNQRLEAINKIIDWSKISKKLAVIHDSGKGRPGWPGLCLFKGLLLQQWYGLSDPGLEEALSDRISFRRFLGLGLTEGTPDHSVFSRFRKYLLNYHLADKLMEEINRQFNEKGLILREGTLMDATLIKAQAKDPGPGNKSEQDPDARFYKKGSQKGFGYKAHIGVDASSGLIRKAVLTPGNVNETCVAEQLISWDEKAVYADAAYDTHQRRKDLPEKKIKARIIHRPNKHHPQLPFWKALHNKLIKPLRSPVERVFGTLKRGYGYTEVRYFGLAKNSLELLLKCMAFNLRRAVVLGA